MKTDKNFKKIEKWLFEYSPDILAGNLDDNQDELTIGEEVPVAPVDQMAMQISRDLPPIEDEAYIPSTSKELSAAADLIASRCPEDQVEYFYREILSLLETAIEKSNTPEIASPDIDLDDKIKRPIVVQKESKNSVGSSKKGYIIDVNKKLGDYMKESSARQKDLARKWKQGDDLKLHRDDDFDFDDDVEFHPDADDLMDFMAANDMDDASDIYGATEETAEQANQEYTLSDILKSNVFPTASRESAITNKLEREMYPILRATHSAPQVTDRLTSLVKSDYAIEAFLDSMYHADLLSDESLEDLQQNPESVKSSEMLKYFNAIAFVRPTMKELDKLAQLGSDVFDPKKKKSQISPEDADRIMKSVKAAWERKNASQKSKIAQKAITHMSEFEGRDKSVMG